MSVRKLIQEFYKPDLLLDPSAVATFLHDDLSVEWNSTKGLVQLKKADIIAISEELQRAYVRSKTKLTHLVVDGDTAAVRYSHYVKTIENPREDILLAHFFVIWEVKDGQLYRGYQMSQLS